MMAICPGYGPIVFRIPEMARVVTSQSVDMNLDQPAFVRFTWPNQ